MKCFTRATSWIGSGYAIATIVLCACSAELTPQNTRALSESESQGSTIVDYTGLCLGAQGGGTVLGAPVELETCDGSPAQSWTEQGGQLVGFGGRCLDALGDSYPDGTTLDLWDCNGGANQQWTLNNDGTIVGVGGLCVDVRAWSSVPGQVMQLWDCNGGQNQAFTLNGAAGGSTGGGAGTGGDGTATWAHCADENGFCSFSGTMTVRYGANGTYVTGTYSDGVLCANSVFGDPLYGVYKGCDIQNASADGSGTPGGTTEAGSTGPTDGSGNNVSLVQSNWVSSSTQGWSDPLDNRLPSRSKSGNMLLVWTDYDCAKHGESGCPTDCYHGGVTDDAGNTYQQLGDERGYCGDGLNLDFADVYVAVNAAPTSVVSLHTNCEFHAIFVAEYAGAGSVSAAASIPYHAGATNTPAGPEVTATANDRVVSFESGCGYTSPSGASGWNQFWEGAQDNSDMPFSAQDISGPGTFTPQWLNENDASGQEVWSIVLSP